MSIRVTVRNFIDADQLKRDLSYSLADLSKALMEQSSLLTHYGVLAAKSSRQVDDIKLVLENAEARIYRKLRDEAALEGTKLTEAQLEKAVAIHDNIVSIKRALNEAKQIEQIAKIAVESFRHRRDMLIQQGLLAREEMKGEATIYRKTEAAEAQKALEQDVMARLRAHG